MYAAAFGNRGTASALLSAGAVLDLADGDGATAEDYGERYAPGQINFLLRNAKKRSTITH
jgi:ankyrin repeat protein